MADGKVAVVTGAGAGAARAVAERFGREGFRVALLSRNVERLEAARAAIAAGGSEALAIPTDTGDCDAVFAARDRVMAEWGRIDVWVNAAMATVVAPVAEMTAEEYRRVTQVTYLGYVHGTLAALGPMRAVNRGAIIQVGSALSYRAIPLQSAYCAAKFAIRGFTDSLRTELIHDKSNITLTMLQMPGMNTPQFDWARNKLSHEYNPVGDVFDPEVCADAAWRAAQSGAREYWVGGSAIQSIVGAMGLPSLLDRILAHAAWEGQISATPNPHNPDNLYQSPPGRQGARGRFSDRSKPKALIVDPELLRFGAIGAALLGIVGLSANALRKQR